MKKAKPSTKRHKKKYVRNSDIIDAPTLFAKFLTAELGFLPGDLTQLCIGLLRQERLRETIIRRIVALDRPNEPEHSVDTQVRQERKSWMKKCYEATLKLLDTQETGTSAFFLHVVRMRDSAALRELAEVLEKPEHSIEHDGYIGKTGDGHGKTQKTSERSIRRDVAKYLHELKIAQFVDANLLKSILEGMAPGKNEPLAQVKLRSEMDLSFAQSIVDKFRWDPEIAEIADTIGFNGPLDSLKRIVRELGGRYEPARRGRKKLIPTDLGT